MGISIQFRAFNTNSIYFNEPYYNYYKKTIAGKGPESKRYYYDIDSTYDNAYYIAVNKYDVQHPILFSFRTYEDNSEKYKNRKKAYDNKIVVFRSAWITMKDYFSLLSKDIDTFSDPVNRSYDWSFWDSNASRLPNALPVKTQDNVIHKELHNTCESKPSNECKHSLVTIKKESVSKAKHTCVKKNSIDIKMDKKDEWRYGDALFAGIGTGFEIWLMGSLYLLIIGYDFSGAVYGIGFIVNIVLGAVIMLRICYVIKRAESNMRSIVLIDSVD